jgi:hypothetical protein
MKKNRGDEPTVIIIHIHTEISQGNSLCIYLYLKQTKCHFFSYKIREQEGGTDAVQGRFGTSGRGEVVGKVDRRVNTMQKNVYMCM